MDHVESAQELRAIFQQTRLAPLGNTFLNSAHEPELEPVERVVRRRRSITKKAHSIPDYIPHQLVSMYGDNDIFEDVSNSDISTCVSSHLSDLLSLQGTSPEPPKGADLGGEPAFVGFTNLREAKLRDDENAERMRWKCGNVLSTRPPALGLLDMVMSHPGTPMPGTPQPLTPLPTTRTSTPLPGTPVRPAPGLEHMVTPPDSPPQSFSQLPPPPSLTLPQQLQSCPLRNDPHEKAEESVGERAAKKENGSSTKGAGGIQGPITTLMIRNLPHELLQSQLAADIDACGFKGKYDFLYMPSTFGTGRGKGYAFVNFATPEVADRLSAMWHNTCRFGSPAERVLLNVSAACIQGRDANVARWDTSKMRRIRNANHRPLVTTLMPDSGALPQTPPEAAPLQTLTVPAAAPIKTAPQAESMVGKWCRIDGLQRMTHANGLWGMVEAYDDSLDRYVMRVPVDADHWFTAKILRENLEVPMY